MAKKAQKSGNEKKRYIIYALIFAAAIIYSFWPLQMKMPLIAHAGGAYGDKVYTNSLEALDDSYAKGFRFFEIDFLMTGDGKMICRHEWEPIRLEAGKLPTAAQVLKADGNLGYTPCDEDSLALWLGKHKDERLITDTKQEDKLAVLQRWAQHKNIMKQIIPQIYDLESYEPAKALGYEDIILTLYFYNGDLGAVKPFLKTHKIYALTMPVGYIVKGKAWQLAGNTPVYTHTINSCFYFRWLKLLGVDGIYTDHIAPGRC